MQIAKAAKVTVLVTLLCGALFFLTLIYVPAIKGFPFASRTAGVLHVMDFVTFYEAGCLARSSDRQHIYDANVQARWLNEIIKPEHSDIPFFTAYPPYFFSMMVVFSFVSLPAAYFIWTLGGLAIMLFALERLLKSFAPLFTVLDRSIFLTGVVASAPLILSLKLGQTTWLLVTCLSAFCLCYARGQFRLAGIAVAISSIKPQYLLFLGMPSLIQRRWSFVISAFVAECLLLVMAGLNVGWHNIIGYPAWLAYVETSPVTLSSISPRTMVSLRGLYSSLFSEQWSHILLGATIIISIAYLVRLWLLAEDRVQTRWKLALTLIIAAVVSPHLHDHDLVFLAVVAALTLPCIGIGEAAKLKEWPLRCWTLTLLYYPLLSWLLIMYRDAVPVPLLAVNDTLLLIFGIVWVEQMAAMPPLVPPNRLV